MFQIQKLGPFYTNQNLILGPKWIKEFFLLKKDEFQLHNLYASADVSKLITDLMKDNFIQFWPTANSRSSAVQYIHKNTKKKNLLRCVNLNVTSAEVSSRPEIVKLVISVNFITS